MPSEDPTTIGGKSPRVALRRRRQNRTDQVHEIPFNERAEVTCEDCGETTTVGIYGATEPSYDSCWTWDCDAYHKFERDHEAEADGEPEAAETRQTKLITDGGRDRSHDEVDRDADQFDGGIDHSGREPENTEAADQVLREALGDDLPGGFLNDDEESDRAPCPDCEHGEVEATDEVHAECDTCDALVFRTEVGI